MRQIAIVADDLTGASDSGVQFTRKGLKTSVLFSTERVGTDTVGIECVAVDTDSRAIPAGEAYARALAAAKRIGEAGFTHIYKKVDSTLRGNLGAEIDGVMDAVHFDLAVVAPAFPRLGRTTVGGRHFLKGQPIHQTEIARDPKCPVTESLIPNLLSAQSKRHNGAVDLQTVRAGKAAIQAAVRQLVESGVQLTIFDADADEDLERIAVAMAGSPYRVLWVGSAGLADYLPGALGIAPAAAAEAWAPKAGPVLLVAGSVSPVTRSQAAAAAAQPETAAVEMNPLNVLTEGPVCAGELSRCRATLQEALAAGRNAVFTSGAAPEQVAAAKKAGEALGLDATAVSNRIAAAMGEVASGVMAVQPLGGAILTGGDTAKAVCGHLGVTGLELVTEVETGVPLSRLVGGQNSLTARLPVVTKAGAFGNDQTLVRAMRVLKGEE